jgi:tRNA pseudouridine38-40 synthase
MNEACSILFNYKDFTSFSKRSTEAKTNLCDIYKAEWKQKGNQLTFTIEANRFLRNMVRSIVGTMIELGEGKLSLDDLKKIIEAKDRTLAGYSIPANGLFLTDIKYPQSIFNNYDNY